MELRVDLETNNANAFAEFTSFSVADEKTRYRLSVSGYKTSSTAGDSVTRHNGFSFSTKDRDYDACSRTCTAIYYGGWWYDKCHSSNLNGLYEYTAANQGVVPIYARSMCYYTYMGMYYAMKSASMKVRPHSCPHIAPGPNVLITGGSSRIGGVITLACSIGYERDTGSYAMLCLHSGTWNGTALTCKRLSCGTPATVANSVMSGTDFSLTGVITYTCSTGYDVTSGTASQTCQSTRAWSGTTPVCGRVSCGQPPSVANSVMSGTDFRYNGVIIYTCSTGYEVTSGTASQTCQSTKTWSGVTPTCGRVHCPTPPVVGNSSLLGSDFRYLGQITYSCSTGYEVTSGTPTQTCQANKTWNGDTPTCGRVSCPTPHVVGNCSMSGNDFRYLRQVTYTCTTGYEVTSGTPTQTCQANKTWDGATPTCGRVSCPIPQAVGNSSMSGGDFQYLGQITYTCSTGYEVKNGTPTQTCQANKAWSGTPPTCGRVTCGQPAHVRNTAVTGSDYQYLGIVTYSCNTGYVMTAGSSTRTCQANKAWSGNLPACKRVNCTVAVPPHAHVVTSSPSVGNISQVIRVTWAYLDSVSWACDAGYQQTAGNQVRTCQANGTFNGILLVCKEIDECASQPCLNNGQCVDHVTYFTCSCLNGYSGNVCQTAPTISPSLQQQLLTQTGVGTGTMNNIISQGGSSNTLLSAATQGYLGGAGVSPSAGVLTTLLATAAAVVLR